MGRLEALYASLKAFPIGLTEFANTEESPKVLFAHRQVTKTKEKSTSPELHGTFQVALGRLEALYASLKAFPIGLTEFANNYM